MRDGLAPLPTGHPRLGSVARHATIVGVVGLVLVAIGVATEPRRALAAYLFGYAAVFTIVTGALIQVMLSHVTGARWFTVMRRLTLDVTGAIPALALLAIPFLVGVRVLYPWADPTTLPPDAQVLIARKAAWLNVPFFVARSVVYLVAWIVVAWSLRRAAHAQDHALGDTAVRATRRLRRLSSIGLVVVALTLTFAAFDWLMSLEPTWYSTIYGVYLFAGTVISGFSFLIILTLGMKSRGLLGNAVNVEHFTDHGRLMFGFVCFWTYVSFSQWMLIWYAGIPEEAVWYHMRWMGGWKAVSILLPVAHFALPFLFLISRVTKRNAATLKFGAVWLVVMHIVDIYWFVMPNVDRTRLSPHWMDVAALFAVGGTYLAVVFFMLRRYPLIPIGDPRLHRSLSHEST